MSAAYYPEQKEPALSVTCSQMFFLLLSSRFTSGGGVDRHQQCDISTALLSLWLPLFQCDQLHWNFPPRCADVQGESTQRNHLPGLEPFLTSNLCVCAGVCVIQQSYDILLLILMVLLLVQAILTSATVVHCASYKSQLRMGSVDSDDRAHTTKRYCEVRQHAKSHVKKWCIQVFV